MQWRMYNVLYDIKISKLQSGTPTMMLQYQFCTNAWVPYWSNYYAYQNNNNNNTLQVNPEKIKKLLNSMLSTDTAKIVND